MPKPRLLERKYQQYVNNSEILNIVNTLGNSGITTTAPEGRNIYLFCEN